MLPPPPITKLVILGDSLSDTHRMWDDWITRYIPDPEVGYWKGRFSNGYIWVDFIDTLSEGKLKIENLAFGGAKSKGRFKAVIHIPSLYEQANEAIRNQGKSPFDPGTGVIIWIGANDVLDNVHNLGAKKTADNIMENIEYATKKLVDKGLLRQHLFLVTLPPMDRVPYYQEKTHLADKGVAGEAIKLANTAMKKLASSEGLRIIDAWGFIQNWLNHVYQDPYMTNLTKPCFPTDPGDDWLTWMSMRPRLKKPPQKIESCMNDKKEFAMFFDTMHPTAVAHCGLAVLMKRHVDGGDGLANFDFSVCETQKMSDVLPSPRDATRINDPSLRSDRSGIGGDIVQRIRPMVKGGKNAVAGQSQKSQKIQKGKAATAGKRPGGQKGKAATAGKRPGGQKGKAAIAGKRPGGQKGKAAIAGKRPGGQKGKAATAGKRPGGQKGKAAKRQQA